jgi:hypothetical protein
MGWLDRQSATVPSAGSWRMPVRARAAGLVLAFLLASMIGCGDDGGPAPVIRQLVDLLPPGTDTMQKDGDPRTATDASGLKGIVGSESIYYTNNGFLEMIEQMYGGAVGGTGAVARVWIFDMGSAENAAALHEELLQGGSWEEWNDLGDEDHRRSTLLGFQILFRRDNYSAQLDISVTSQDARDVLFLFATQLDEAIIGE